MNPDNDPDDNPMDISNCRTLKESTGIISCLMKESCRWAISVLDVRYCTNPSVSQIPGSSNP